VKKNSNHKNKTETVEETRGNLSYHARIMLREMTKKNEVAEYTCKALRELQTDISQNMVVEWGVA
jgi:hypothetical protein